MCLRDIVKGQNTVAELEKEVGAKGHESPEWELGTIVSSNASAIMVSHQMGKKTYHRDYLILENSR